MHINVIDTQNAGLFKFQYKEGKSKYPLVIHSSIFFSLLFLIQMSIVCNDIIPKAHLATTTTQSIDIPCQS